MGKVFAALQPGGQILRRDPVLEPDRSGPPDATLFALQMLLATQSDELDTRNDWANWLLSAGFSSPQQVALPEWLDSFLTLSSRPD